MKRRFRWIEGKVVEVTDRGPSPQRSASGGAYGEGNPLESIACSCHPDQAAEYNDAAKKAGLTGVSFDKRGRCRFTSRGQRAKYLKLIGAHDADGGYGDG